jgi:catechol 2,3-dioxygenase-like lactoylglutathione lyase family enzyme
MPNIHPRSFNHVGVGVSDLEQAIRWYHEVFGFVLLHEPFEVSTDDGSYSGRQAANVLGNRFRSMRMAHMSSGNGVGIELFQLLVPPHERRTPSLEFWKSGFFHICVTDPDVETAVARIVEHGGNQLSDIWAVEPQSKDHRICYCEDLFGNIIEIYSHSYEQMYGGISHHD